QYLVDDGQNVEPHLVDGWWKDTGRLEDMLEANRLVLDDIDARTDGEAIDSTLEGRVVIEAGARLERCVVRGPAVIGAGAQLTDAYVGPYTSIDSNVKIERAEIEYSIVLEGSTISDLGARLEASLIGKHSQITRTDGMPKTFRLLVGDNCEISLV
ncbi:MAG: glucose-1-phosphate thymidylyltransferase, partial [Solirubrobacterales bacterium]